MDCESNYQVSNPSKQIILQTFKVQGQKPRLNRSFYTHSKKLFLASKYNTQISSPLPKKGAMMEPASMLQKLEP